MMSKCNEVPLGTFQKENPFHVGMADYPRNLHYKKLLTSLSRYSLTHPNTAIQLSGQLHTHQARGWVCHRASLNTREKGEMCPCMELKGCTGTTLPSHSGFIPKMKAVCFLKC
jgi:hypothetical protein